MRLGQSRQALRPRSVVYQFGKKTWHLTGQRTTQISTLFGKLRFTRKIGKIPGQKRLAADLPIDRELGLVSSFSTNVILHLSKLCAQMAFAVALQNFREVFEWAPSRNAVLRMVDHTGEQAKLFLEQAPAPKDDGEILVIQVDAKGTPHLSEQELKKRKESKAISCKSWWFFMHHKRQRN